MRSLLKLLRYFVQYRRITLQKFQSGVTKGVDYLCLWALTILMFSVPCIFTYTQKSTQRTHLVTPRGWCDNTHRNMSGF